MNAASADEVDADTFVGQWVAVAYNGGETDDDNYNTAFNADGTGIFGTNDTFTWSYNEDTEILEITDGGHTIALSVLLEDGLLTIQTKRNQAVEFTMTLRRRADAED